MSAARHPALWDLRGQSILIVDELPQVRTMLRELLVSCAADQIESLSDPERALEWMAAERPDIILCGYDLGEGKDGQQVLEEARERDLIPYSTIFILISAENTLRRVMGAVEHEPDAYLAKPFTREVLQSRLRRLQQKKAHFRDIGRAVEQRAYTRACRLCDDAIVRLPDYRIELLRLKADALKRMGDHAAAADVCREVLKDKPAAWAQLNLAHALFRQGQPDAAANILQAAIQGRPHFVAAYDLLADVLAEQGDSAQAEAMLTQAVALSPKSPRRQRALAEAALRNDNLDMARQAYSQAIREGRHSAFSGPQDFAGLARVQVQSGEAEMASKTLSRMQRSYAQADPAIRLQMAVVEADVEQAMGNPKAQAAAVARAEKLLEDNAGALSAQQRMMLAESCMACGRTEVASDLVREVVRSNHDNDGLLDRARQMFEQADMAELGAQLIDAERADVIRLNNDAVALSRKGDIKGAVAMLLQAAQAMPDNIVINLNAAQAMLQMMQREGPNWRLLRRTQRLLTGLSDRAGGQARFQKLIRLAQAMEQQLDSVA